MKGNFPCIIYILQVYCGVVVVTRNACETNCKCTKRESLNVVRENEIPTRYLSCRRVVKQQGEWDEFVKKNKNSNQIKNKRTGKVFYYRIPTRPINCVRNFCFLVVKTFLGCFSFTQRYTTVIVAGCLFFLFTRKEIFFFAAVVYREANNELSF